MKLGLTAIDAVCNRLERPERAVACVLVGGTNGKGSTAATLASLALASGRRAGLYTSPHLISVTERFRIGAEDVAPARLDAALSAVFAAADRAPDIPLTYFEAATAAAFVLFRDAEVDVALLEVGLGGRFDATNVASPGLSIVTSIDLDHMIELGDTLPLIAVEKAGIFRPGRPALARADDAPALAVLSAAAEAAGAQFHRADREISVRVTRVGIDGTEFELTTPERTLSLRTPLSGEHQAWNAALAVRGAELFPEAFGRLESHALSVGVGSVRWPGRLERLVGPGGRPVLLDGCHNPAGAHALARFLEESGLAGRVPLVFGAMADKDVEGIAAWLFPRVSEVVLVAAAPPRGASPEELLRRVGALAARARTAPDAARAFAALAADPDANASAPIIVAGSLYVVGEARAHLLARQPEGARVSAAGSEEGRL
jgi:dihydrofolate synthase/folylpolyglutamate synthase